MEITRTLRESLGALIAGLPGAGEIEIALEVPPRAEMGDLATPVCFELARRLRRPPRAIAQELAALARDNPLPGVARVEVAGGGYLNVFLDRNAFLIETARSAAGGFASPEPRPGKIIVEHTNINPNKAAHIGHLRNAVLGDTLVRSLRRLGHQVEVQNYIDDTGVQVADLVVGFREIEKIGPDEVRALVRSRDESESGGGAPFDHYCWDLYARVAGFYESAEENRACRARVLRAMEEGEGEDARLAAFLAARLTKHHLRTMRRIGVTYDLLPRESDILRLEFWARAFRSLRESGAIRLADGGKNRGCWVMDLEGAEEGAGEDQKIIVRSDGTVTYVGKDIAYQLWKFGLLGCDFLYLPVDWSGFPWSGYPLWQTGSSDGSAAHPPFGGATRVYNVIDVRQSYLQRVVAQGLRALGRNAQAEQSVHFSYEMVALSPASVQALFPDYPLDEDDRARPYLEMSGRRGLGVKADDLIDELIRRARKEVDSRHRDLPPPERGAIAERIAVAALRYYMLRFTRNRVVAFDIDDALSFEGETGPYCQYAVVRARSILAKLPAAEADDAGDVVALAARCDLGALPEGDALEHWALLREMAQLPAVVGSAVDSLELASLARFCHHLAQTFNSFYHRYQVIHEPDAAVRRLRVALCVLFIGTMQSGLELLGIEVPDRM